MQVKCNFLHSHLPGIINYPPLPQLGGPEIPTTNTKVETALSKLHHFGEIYTQVTFNMVVRSSNYDSIFKS